MKTFKNLQIVYLIVYVSVITAVLLLTACSKDDAELNAAQSPLSGRSTGISPRPGVVVYSDWREDFTTANSLTTRWTLYGTSQPKYVYSAFGRWGLFDNNGVSPNGSYAVSKTQIGDNSGYVIESDVYIDIQNPEGENIIPEIGVTRYLNPPSDISIVEAGISMRLVYIGKGVAVTPARYQDHTYIQTSSLNFDGTISSSGRYNLEADNTGNGWHKMKIVVSSDQQVSFYLDDQLVFNPSKKIHPSLMKNKNVMLGRISSGTAGKAYHDWVRVSYPLPQ